MISPLGHGDLVDAGKVIVTRLDNDFEEFCPISQANWRCFLQQTGAHPRVVELKCAVSFHTWLQFVLVERLSVQ